MMTTDCSGIGWHSLRRRRERRPTEPIPWEDLCTCSPPALASTLRVVPFDNNCMPFGNNMAGMSGGGGGNNNNMAVEMELLKRQLDMVHQKYENERMQREMLEQERNGAVNPSMSGNNFNNGGGGGGGMGMQGGGNQMPRRYNPMSSSRNLLSLLDDNFSRLQSDRYRLPPQPPLTLNSFSSFGNGMQYQQGMKRQAGPGMGSWDMKRQRY
ncbi:hypothetical protein Pmani_002971 [Petrolisthes manimaculis]|uniref:Uncharacterized protein n=1 Tax=Petrolisthes manimaculis TaxID=1843537 RepID=A0AAE1UIX4_9EUCA|nr:hypothetical protein Pmani_002971 [Petrolisthes manimaculis]